MNEEEEEIDQSDIRVPIAEINNKDIYILGVDPARTGKDETALVVLVQLAFDTNIFIFYLETIDTPDLGMLIGRVQYLDTIFHFKKIIIDETGLGAGVSDSLKAKMQGRVTGIWYTNKSKNEIFINLKLLMSRARRKLWIPDFETSTDAKVRKLFYQLLSIQMEVSDKSDAMRITHEAREHDDIVNALALAASYFNVLKRRRTYGIGGYGL